MKIKKYAKHQLREHLGEVTLSNLMTGVFGISSLK
jgi:hypothetical protein